MKERFFFYRVGIGGADLIVIKRIELAVDIFPHAAMAEVAIRYHTTPVAKIALDLVVVGLDSTAPQV